jgi:hypothetical protein
MAIKEVHELEVYQLAEKLGDKFGLDSIIGQ